MVPHFPLHTHKGGARNSSLFNQFAPVSPTHQQSPHSPPGYARSDKLSGLSPLALQVMAELKMPSSVEIGAVPPKPPPNQANQPSQSDDDPHQPQAAPVDDLLTLVITTSPTPSAPSTELLSVIMDSFKRFCPGLASCRVILVLDTFDRIADAPRLKKGHVTAEGASKYTEYKENAKQLILSEYCVDPSKGGSGSDASELLVTTGDAEFGSDLYAQQTNSVPLTITRTRNGRVTFIEPTQRVGFGLAVRSALRLVKTKYVWIQQHDWSLVSDIPLGELLRLMQQQQPGSDDDENVMTTGDNKQVLTVPIKYVCFPSIRMVSYATSDHVMLFPALRALTNLHKQKFSMPPNSQGERVKIPLTPLFFWHDKPHLAETEHYLAKVFPHRRAMPRGAFIEDTVGHQARNEMKDGQWKKWACWLYYPDEGKQLCVKHLKGRTYRGAEAELAQKLERMKLGVVAGEE